MRRQEPAEHTPGEPRLGSDEKILNLAIVVVIATVSLAVAWVCFAVLDSHAEGGFQAYTLGGALAGFVVTASLLWSIYEGLRRSDRRLETLRRKNRELEQKLIRGVPHPEGYVVEVDEKERLVIARPETWARNGGTLYAFVKTPGDAGDECPRDPFPARLTISYEEADPETDGGPRSYYERLQKWGRAMADDGLMISPIFEHAFVGEAPDGILSLKVAYAQWTIATWDRDPRLGRWTHNYRIITTADAKQLQSAIRDAESNGGGQEVALAAVPTGGAQSARERSTAPVAVEEGASNRVLTYHVDVLCYHEALKRIFHFEFVDDSEDFAEASTGFNHVLNSTRFLT